MGDLLLHNLGSVVTAAGGPRRGAALARSSVAAGADALLARDGVIVAVGALTDLEPLCARDVVGLDGGGRLATPGLVDCHTHLIYAGDRADEFEQRLGGASYLEILAAGGGILATVAKTRAADDDELLAAARARAEAMARAGVTTAEVKSGYALTTDGEVRMLRVARRLNAAGPVEIIPTFMGAHALPLEYASRRAAFVKLVCDEMIPAVAREGLAVFADCFCDRGAFDLAETSTILNAARAAGLGLRLHADEFEPLGGVELAAELGAASVDHLAVITDDGVRALAASRTAAVLLPGTTMFLGSTHFAPARRLVEAGAVVALASDHNPGSCHAASLGVILTPAASFLKLRPAEVIHAVTVNAAYALGAADRLGSLEPGKQADVAVFDAGDVNELFYDWGARPAWATIKRGAVIHGPAAPPPARAS
jgi:imidazolonepropionase